MAALNYTESEINNDIQIYDSSSPWQLAVVFAILIWLIVAQFSAFTTKLRALVQPFVLRYVESGVPVILTIQSYRHPWLDAFMALLATAVSTPFYSLVLPLLFWHGHAKLARQMTLLMATCIYVGNSCKDLICAPRPSPPVCRVVSSESEIKGSEEYGLPSSHSINIICFAGYLIHYLMSEQVELITFFITTALLTIIVTLVIFGRLYLGMHSPIDVLTGCAIGASTFLGWCYIDEYLDAFITNGKNVIPFWAAIAILGLYAYPTPESLTPSFEDHTAFNGVAFGVVSGVRRTFSLYQSGLPSAVSLTPTHVGMKTALGIVTIFAAKEASKSLATIFLPWICCIPELLLGFRFYSTSYVKPMRKGVHDDVEATGLCGNLPRNLQPYCSVGKAMDVDTGIRFVQYAALGWAVVELVPRIFSYLTL